MAYQEIAAPASAAAVVDAIRSFAEANGWTVNRNNLVGADRTVTLSRSGLDYIHVYNIANVIYLRGSIDYASGTAPDATTRRSSRAVLPVGVGPYTKLFLFADTTPSVHVHVVLETAVAGNYLHASFGMIDKVDTFTGGTYCDASNWPDTPTSQIYNWNAQSTHALFGMDNNVNSAQITSECGTVRCDISGERTDGWATISALSYSNIDTNNFPAYTNIYYSEGSDTSPPHSASYLARNCDDNGFSNRSIFHVIEVHAGRTGGYISPLGSFPNIRFCNIAKFTDVQEITIGSDVWKIFPMVKRGLGNQVYPNYTRGSENNGYAYKKVT